MPHVVGQKVDKGLRNWNFSSQWSVQPFNHACDFHKLFSNVM